MDSLPWDSDSDIFLGQRRFDFPTGLFPLKKSLRGRKKHLHVVMYSLRESPTVVKSEVEPSEWCSGPGQDARGSTSSIVLLGAYGGTEILELEVVSRRIVCRESRTSF
jgi:hypothetical protein